jgi:hypothetical protein
MGEVISPRVKAARLVAIVLLGALPGATGCTPEPAHPKAAEDDDAEVQLRAHPNVDVARDLDQEGVRAFRDGHYGDAIRYFRAARRLGGPSSELWNIARSRERLDDGEGAARALDDYLRQRDLAPQDRAEAQHELQAIRSRPSPLTVTTTPPGAAVSLDGRAAGPTPLTTEVGPGVHTLAVRLGGYEAQSRAVQARFGRPVIVTLDLARAHK